MTKRAYSVAGESRANGALAVLYCLVIHWPLTASTARKVTVAYAAMSPIMAGVWMAKEIGAYEKYGLQADLVFIASGAVAAASLISGDLDMAVAASNAVIAAVSKGAPLGGSGQCDQQTGSNSLGSA